MKNILIIADGILAKYFLETIIELKTLKHKYTIISYKDITISQKLKGENITIQRFDPTSYEKLRLGIHEKFDIFMVIMDEKIDTFSVYQNLRKMDKNKEIYLLDKWGLLDEIDDDNHTKIIDALSILTSRLIGYLPDHPILADSIGLGKGEIMEVKVPIGSSFSYKKIGLFSTQKEFKIPMIYRHNKAITAQFGTMIFPNDTLLVVGEPNVLQDVYKAIKESKGQFPSPFGINFYLIVDMINLCQDDFEKIIKNVKYLNESVTNHKFYIRVINPTLTKMFEEIKKLDDDESCEILIEYSKNSPEIMKSDIVKHKVGMVISNNAFFEKHKKSLYELKVPVLTLGKGDVKDLKKGVVLMSDKSNASEASVVFDLCGQLGLDVYLHYYAQEKNQELIARYKDLAELFKKELFIIEDDAQNPFLKLKNEENFLHFVPFNDKVLHRKPTSVFSKDLDELYFAISQNYQLFIPDFYEI